MIYIVDASVAVKWFAEEEKLVDDAIALLADEACRLEAPDFLFIEIANVAWKKVRLGEFLPEQPAQVLAQLRRSVVTIHASADLLERALQIALACGHPVYDGLYLATAEVANGTVVTADERLLNALSGTNWASRAVHLETAAFSRDEYLPLLAVSNRTIEEIVAAAQLYETVGESVRQALHGREEWALSNTEEMRLVLESPAGLRLSRLIAELSPIERADILALGWFGREATLGHAGREKVVPDFRLLQQQARQQIESDKTDPLHVSYVAGICFFLEDGWQLWKARS